MALKPIADGETVEIEGDDELVLKWFANGTITRLEIYPVPVGNSGSKQILYQPAVMGGEMAFTPLTTGDIYADFYGDDGKVLNNEVKLGTYVFHVNVKGSNGFIQQFVGYSASGRRIFAGDELEVDKGEPVNFYWKSSAKGTQGSLNGRTVDPKGEKLCIIMQDSGDYTLEIGDGSSSDKQTIKVTVSSENYEGLYDKDAQEAIANTVLTASVDIGGTDPSLLEGFFLTTEENDVPRWSAQIEKGKPVTLHFKVHEDVDHIEIYDGVAKRLTPDVPVGGGEGDVEVTPDKDTDYTITVFSKPEFTEGGERSARGSVHVGVHTEGDDVSEHRSNLPSIKFAAEKEWEIYTSQPATILKYLKWQFEMGIKLEGELAFENESEGPGTELGAKNLSEFALTASKLWEQKHGEEYRDGIKLTPTSVSEVSADIVKYDKKENRLQVLAVEWKWTDGKVETSITGTAIDMQLKTVGDIRMLCGEGEVSASLGSLDFELGEHVKVDEVKIGPYAKVSIWVDWRAVAGEAIEDAAEDAAEDGAELAGAEVALVGGAALMAVAIVALAVDSVMKAADMIDLGSEVSELKNDTIQGYKAALAGGAGQGGYWYSRGAAVGAQVIKDRQAELKKIDKNKSLSDFDFDKKWGATWTKYQSNFVVPAALQKVIDSCLLSLWNGYGIKYLDSRWSGSSNNVMRENGWRLIYGGPPQGAMRPVFHKFDNEFTTTENFHEDFRATK